MVEVVLGAVQVSKEDGHTFRGVQVGPDTVVIPTNDRPADDVAMAVAIANLYHTVMNATQLQNDTSPTNSE